MPTGQRSCTAACSCVLALEVAENQGGPVFRGQASHFLVDDGPKLVPVGVARSAIFPGCYLRNSPLPIPSSARIHLGSHGNPPGHAMKPGAEHRFVADRCGPLDQNEKGGLKCVVNVVRVGENPPADGKAMGPCLWTMASKATSSRWERNRSRSWLSLAPVMVPSENRPLDGLQEWFGLSADHDHELREFATARFSAPERTRVPAFFDVLDGSECSESSKPREPRRLGK